VAISESPGIGQAGGPGDFGLGGGWPDDHHKEFLFPYLDNDERTWWRLAMMIEPFFNPLGGGWPEAA